MDKAAQRREALERMLDDAKRNGTSISQAQLANHFHVSSKTIQRDIDELEANGYQPAPRISAEALALYDDVQLSTLAALERAIRRVDGQLETINAELGFTQKECPECNRKKLDMNALMMSANFKGGDTLKGLLELLARARGELVDNVVITVQQRDSDVALIMQVIAAVRSVTVEDLITEKSFANPDGSVNVKAVTEALVRRMLNGFQQESQRRAARLPTARQVFDVVGED